MTKDEFDKLYMISYLASLASNASKSYKPTDKDDPEITRQLLKKLARDRDHLWLHLDSYLKMSSEIGDDSFILPTEIPIRLVRCPHCLSNVPNFALCENCGKSLNKSISR